MRCWSRGWRVACTYEQMVFLRREMMGVGFQQWPSGRLSGNRFSQDKFEL